jgi:hypothetical protein
MNFITIGRFVINVNLITSIEVHRHGNGSDLKVTGQDHAIRLSDQETETLMEIITPMGGVPTPL